VSNPPYPNNAPPGTHISDIWVQYRNSLFVGLYTGMPSLCPPEPYATIPQPTWGGYSIRGAEGWQELASIPSEVIALQRFAVLFPVGIITTSVTVMGWFVVCRFSDGSMQTLGLFPFTSSLLVSSPGQAVLVNGEVSSGPSGQPSGASLQNVTSAQGLMQGKRMPYAFRREQRACIRTAITALSKLQVWDGELPRPSGPPPLPIYRGVLSNLPIVPNQNLVGDTEIPTHNYFTQTTNLILWLQSQLKVYVPPA